MEIKTVDDLIEYCTEQSRIPSLCARHYIDVLAGTCENKACAYFDVLKRLEELKSVTQKNTKILERAKKDRELLVGLSKMISLDKVYLLRIIETIRKHLEENP